MKRLFTTLFVIPLLFTSVKAQEAPPADNPNAAILTFDKSTHDYGTIKKGADGNCEFTFKNTGKEPLIISNAKGSCGCTVPQWPREPILPGKTGSIKVHYDTNRPGAINKTVTVTSNAKNSPTVLKIKGMVEVPPPDVAFPTKKPTESGMPFEDNKKGF